MIFDDIKNRREAERKTPPATGCPPAIQFESWAAAHYQEVVDNPTAVGINVKILLFTKKYFEYRTAVPKAHRNHFGGGHQCIFAVYETYIQRLLELERAITPALSFLASPQAPIPAPPPPAPKTLSVPAITLGEIVQGEA